jgi:hypothetical protein
MSIWNKVLVGLVFVASAVFLFAAMRTLKTYQYWRNLTYGYEFFLEKDEEICRTLEEGGEVIVSVEDGKGLSKLKDFYKRHQYNLNVPADTKWEEFVKLAIKAIADTGRLDRQALAECTYKMETTEGLQQARLVLSRVLNQRGRVWDNLTALTLEDQTGRFSATNGQPDRQGLGKELLVYVFDRERQEGDKGPRYLGYLGEFVVESVVDRKKPAPGAGGKDDKEVLAQLKPSRELTPGELEQLKQSFEQNKDGKRRWVLYERMPWDSHELFAGVDEAAKKKLLPQQTVEEYVHDGQRATWADVKEWKVPGTVVDDQGRPLLDKEGKKTAEATGIYRRPLRDYKALFDWYDMQRTVLYDLIATTQRNLKLAEKAKAEAEAERDACRQEKVTLTAERAERVKERSAVLVHWRAVEAQAKLFAGEVNRLMKKNQDLARQIAKMQAQALQQAVDARTRSMVQSGEGR